MVYFRYDRVDYVLTVLHTIYDEERERVRIASD